MLRDFRYPNRSKIAPFQEPAGDLFHQNTHVNPCKNPSAVPSSLRKGIQNKTFERILKHIYNHILLHTRATRGSPNFPQHFLMSSAVPSERTRSCGACGLTTRLGFDGPCGPIPLSTFGQHFWGRSNLGLSPVSSQRKMQSLGGLQ